MAVAIKFLDPMSHFISKVLDGEEVEKNCENSGTLM